MKEEMYVPLDCFVLERKGGKLSSQGQGTPWQQFHSHQTKPGAWHCTGTAAFEKFGTTAEFVQKKQTEKKTKNVIDNEEEAIMFLSLWLHRISLLWYYAEEVNLFQLDIMKHMSSKSHPV